MAPKCLHEITAAGCVMTQNSAFLCTLLLLSALHLSTHTLTPHSTVLLEQLTGSQLVKKFPTFHRTRRFITAFTSARHLSLSWASSIQSIPPHIPLPKDPSYYYPPIYAWVSQVVSFFQVSPPKPCIQLSSPLYLLHSPPISFFSMLSPEQYWGSSTDH